MIFFELLPFANLDIENLISQKLLQLGASNLDSLQKIMSRLTGDFFLKKCFFLVIARSKFGH